MHVCLDDRCCDAPLKAKDHQHLAAILGRQGAPSIRACCAWAGCQQRVVVPRRSLECVACRDDQAPRGKLAASRGPVAFLPTASMDGEGLSWCLPTAGACVCGRWVHDGGVTFGLLALWLSPSTVRHSYDASIAAAAVAEYRKVACTWLFYLCDWSRRVRVLATATRRVPFSFFEIQCDRGARRQLTVPAGTSCRRGALTLTIGVR